MTIPKTVKIKKGELPNEPGVYFMKDAKGHLLYVGKAVNLERRVKQYWQRPHGEHIERMVPKIAKVDYKITGSAIEALILEANEIRKHKPSFNVIGKDDASFLHLVITNEDFPKAMLVRGHELERMPKKAYKRIFGPYTSSASLRAALELTRKLFGWSNCEPGQKRACFNHHLKMCPGVCIGEVTKDEYAKTIRHLILFFDGKKGAVMKSMEREMKKAAKEERFEDANRLKHRLYALIHINDVSVIKQDDLVRSDDTEVVNIFGRVEAYDISNTGDTEIVGVMTTSFEGLPKKSWYKKFKMKTVTEADDVASMTEMLMRRFKRAETENGPSWALPDMIVIDGGKPQVNAAQKVLDAFGLDIPMIGLAKGFDRKQDVIVYPIRKKTPELQRVVIKYKKILQNTRDEAHRFAITFHRKRRGKKFLPKLKK